MKHVLALFIILLFILLLRFSLSLYKIPSSSMIPTLEIGDRIVVYKMNYGIRMINPLKFIKEKKISYHLQKRFKKPKKKDICVFNWPNYKSLQKEYHNIYGSLMVKRCFAASGDTVIIQSEEMNDLEEANIRHLDYFNFEKYLFPHDSAINWTINNYGPLWVPQNGITIKLSPNNSRLYLDVLLYEGYKTTIRNDSVFLNGEFTEQYTFKENYYFMIGDNFYDSNDSRYWGFVPEKNIVGKVIFVFFSLDTDKSWYRKFRWKRFLKRIE